jgi:outer membrane receptor protein involved in Fe transport
MHKHYAVIVSAAPLIAAGPALADASDSAVQAGVHAETGLTEIIVTATRREESLQDVPVSVNAVSGDDLQRGSVARLQDLQLPSRASSSRRRPSSTACTAAAASSRVRRCSTSRASRSCAARRRPCSARTASPARST